jgi:hypothetical protein
VKAWARPTSMVAHQVRTRQVAAEDETCWKKQCWAGLSPWIPRIRRSHCAVSSLTESHRESVAVAVGAAVESGHS